MTSYGYRLNENIEWINQLLEKISKTKKKVFHQIKMK